MNDSKGFLLVVDDEEFNRDMLSRRLEVEGYTSLSAANGPAALSLLKQHRFDAVLLDAMMPGQSGYEVLAEIRQSHSALELPVLMVTAKTMNDDVVNAFDLGANDYINKPINFPIALARIQSAVSSKRLSSQLRESEERYALSAKGANDGLWDWDLINNRIIYSPRWKSMLGYETHEIGDLPEEWLDRVHPDDRPHLESLLAAHRDGQTLQFENEHRMRHRDETYRWFLSRGAAVRDEHGKATRMAGSQTDITRGKAADPLTGLPNRVLFMDHLSAAVGESQGECEFAVLFIDLDRFKVINDSLGHLAGDELLVTVASRLEMSLRSTDVILRPDARCTVSRFGGDEFVVLLKGITEVASATGVADRLLRAISAPMTLCGHEIRISGSIGIAVGGRLTGSVDDLVRDADTAMYHAKSNGKSRWSLFDASLRQRALERLQMEEDLKRGLDRQEFELVYQPIIAMPSQQVQGFEALLRWRHPVRGMVSPAQFVPIAEEIGVIIPLGIWVLETACRQLRAWQLEHVGQQNLYMSVNVSTRQFTDPNLVASVEDCLQRTGVDSSHLKLEITESAIMIDPTEAAEQIEKLRMLGVRISLDDFGTGYSSLSYLHNFQIDTLKIDRSFVSRLGNCSDSEEIVKTIIGLAHKLGITVVAEGIEELSQHSWLKDMRCEAGQGYLYSKPVSVSSIDKLLSQPRDLSLQTPSSMEIAAEAPGMHPQLAEVVLF